MVIVNKRVGERLRKARLMVGKTQEDTAFESGIDYSFYNQVENGKRNVSVKILARIARVLKVPLKTLFD